MTSEWKDWYTETYEYTVGSIENLGAWYPYKEEFIVCLKRLDGEVK